MACTICSDYRFTFVIGCFEGEMGLFDRTGSEIFDIGVEAYYSNKSYIFLYFYSRLNIMANK